MKGEPQDASPWSRQALAALWGTTVEALFNLVADARSWAEEKSPWVRMPLALYLGYAGIRHLLDESYRSWFGGLTLGVHELGHLITLWAPLWLNLLAGTIFQLAAPALVIIYFVRSQRDYFGSAVGACWLGFAAFDTAVYVGDAAATELPLVALGNNAIHDWSWLLTHAGLLKYCHELATFVWLGGLAAWLLGMASMAGLLSVMWRSE